jgi:hypothetical protein
VSNDRIPVGCGADLTAFEHLSIRRRMMLSFRDLSKKGV